MKHLFILLFVSLFSFAAVAQNCPPGNPLPDMKGHCYSCDDERTFVSVPYAGEISLEPNEIQYHRGDCEQLCPNRLVYSDGWLDAPHYCVVDTFKNRITALLINNVISIFNPVNWINFFLLIIILSHTFIWIFKKYESRALTNTIKFFCILLSFPLTLVFINNLIVTLMGILFIIGIKLKRKEPAKKEKHLSEKPSRILTRIIFFFLVVLFILALLIIITGLLIFLGNNL